MAPPVPGPAFSGTTNSGQPNPVNLGGPDPTMYGISQNQGALEIPLGQGGLYGLTPGYRGYSGAPGNEGPSHARGTQSVPLSQLIQEFYQLSRDQQIAIEQQLWQGGFYTDSAGNAMRSAPQFGAFSADTTKALQSAALQAVGTGRALNTVIGDAVTSGAGAAQHNLYKPGIVSHGYRNVIDLRNPADVQYAVEQMSEKLLGRKASDEDKQTVINLIQSQDFADGMAKYTAQETMSQQDFQARVAERDAQFGYMTGYQNNPGGQGGTAGGGGGPAAQQQVMAYLQGKGLSAAQAAGVVGNLQQESNLDPNAPGGGIAQWIGGRQQNLQAFAAQQRKSPNDLTVQLDFLWHELNGSESGALQALKQTTDAASAAQAFSNSFERPGTPMMSNRVNYANQALAGSAAGGSGTANASGAPMTVGGQSAGVGLGSNLASSFISTAESQIGVPYQWGGETSGQAFDCSGLVQWAMKQHGLDPGRTTYQQFASPQGAKVDSLNHAQPGDLIFFDPTGGQSPDHVGIYLGDGQMLDADHSGSTVGIRKSVQGYGTIVGIKRFPLGSGQSGTNVIAGQDTYIPGANTIMTAPASADAAAYQQMTTGANELPFEAHTTLNNVGIINNMIKGAR